MAAYPLVLTKLAFPLAPEPHIVRERIIALLEEAWARKVTLIFAAAGYGKSTAVSDFCRLRAAERSAWYSLDAQDSDPATFLSHFAVSLARRISELVEPLLPVDAVISQCAARAGDAGAMGEDCLRTWHAALSLVVNATLERLRRDILVVLDDYHELARESHVHQLVSYFVEHLPPQVHLIVCSRQRPPLALERARAHGRLLEIGEDELRTSVEEAGDILSACLSAELPPEVLRQAIDRSEGWITGLALAARAFSRRKGEGWGVLLEQSHRHAARFLLEQVDAGESAENGRTLRELAVFNYIYPELCQVYFGRDDAATVLADMAGRNLFLRRLEGPRETYQIHALFRRALLTDVAASGGPSALQRLHRRAGEALGQLGLSAQAVSHLLAAGEWDKAVEAVDIAAPDLVACGRIRTVWKWLEQLQRVQSGRAACLAEINRARILRIWGKATDAGTAIARAESSMVNERDNWILKARILSERSELAFLSGDYSEARRFAGEALQLLETQNGSTASSDGIKPLLADINATLGACLAYGGSEEECLGYFKRAEQLYHETGDVASEAEMIARTAVFVHEVRGEFRAGVLALERAARLARVPLSLEEARKRSRPAVDTGRIDYYLGTFYGNLGEHERAMTYLKRALESVQRSDHRLNEALVRAKMGFVYLQMDMWEEALDEFLEAQALLAETKEPFRLANVYYGLSVLYRLRGDYEQAFDFALRDLEAVTTMGNELFVAQSRVNVAAVSLGLGKAEEVLAALELSETVFRRWQAKFDLVFLKLVEARALQIVSKDLTAIQKPLAEALRLTQEGGYDWLWRREKESAVPLLKAFLWQKPGDVFARKLLRSLGEGAISKEEGQRPCREIPVVGARDVRREGGEGSSAGGFYHGSEQASKERGVVGERLSAFLFGEFEVWVNSSRMNTELWRPRVADLFKYLALARGRWVPTDRLVETFWPSMDPGEGRRNLTVNIYYLRRTLEPGLARGEGSLYLQSRRDSYRLAMEDGVWTDVDEFFRLWESLKPDLRAEAGLCRPGRAEREERTSFGRDRSAALVVETCRRLVELHRAELLVENPYDDWAVAARQEARQVYMAALYLLAQAAYHDGRLEEACQWGQTLVNAEPSREEAHRLLMMCYYRQGRRDRALRQFHECRRALENEFGVGPMPETMRLYQAILDESPPVAIAR